MESGRWGGKGGGGVSLCVQVVPKRRLEVHTERANGGVGEAGGDVLERHVDLCMGGDEVGGCEVDDLMVGVSRNYILAYYATGCSIP